MHEFFFFITTWSIVNGDIQESMVPYTVSNEADIDELVMLDRLMEQVAEMHNLGAVTEDTFSFFEIGERFYATPHQIQIDTYMRGKDYFFPPDESELYIVKIHGTGDDLSCLEGTIVLPHISLIPSAYTSDKTIAPIIYPRPALTVRNASKLRFRVDSHDPAVPARFMLVYVRPH